MNVQPSLIGALPACLQTLGHVLLKMGTLRPELRAQLNTDGVKAVDTSSDEGSLRPERSPVLCRPGKDGPPVCCHCCGDRAAAIGACPCTPACGNAAAGWPDSRRRLLCVCAGYTALRLVGGLLIVSSLVIGVLLILVANGPL